MSQLIQARSSTFDPITQVFMKKTLILGASPNPDRYSYKATARLAEHKHEVVPVGIRAGEIEGHSIITDRPVVEGVDTVTLYIGPARQPDYYEYIFSVNPKRIIFNPGTENEELAKMANERGIETEIACTLVLLSTDQY